MKGLIVTGGKCPKYDILKKYYDLTNYIIAVDKGAEYLIKNNLKFDLAIGDFDSIEEKFFAYIEEENIEYKKLNVEKNDSDTEAAINELEYKNCKEIYILAGTGSRLDHTITNIFILKRLYKKGIKAFIIDDNNRIRIAEGKEIIYREYENISIVPLSLGGANITLKGFYYKLENEDIEYGSSRCLSNYLNEDIGEVIIKNGMALIIESKD